MKTTDESEMNKGEGAFSAGLGIVLLLMVPAWGGTGMLLGLAAGSVAYALIFRKRLRDRGWLGAVISLAAAALVAAAVVVVLSMRQGRWF
jgi:O-antigen ligase